MDSSEPGTHADVLSICAALHRTSTLQRRERCTPTEAFRPALRRRSVLRRSVRRAGRAAGKGHGTTCAVDYSRSCAFVSLTSFNGACIDRTRLLKAIPPVVGLQRKVQALSCAGVESTARTFEALVGDETLQRVSELLCGAVGKQRHVCHQARWAQGARPLRQDHGQDHEAVVRSQSGLL